MTGKTILPHCTTYECCLNGSNSLEETDRHPLWLCSECIAKICWVTGADPVTRYHKLADFCRKHDLPEEARFFTQAFSLLK